MTIYMGNSNSAKKIKNMYIGINDEAKKIKYAYIGIGNQAKLFYQDLLPKEYQQVEYIQNTGKQYIDPIVYPDKDTTILIDYQLTREANVHSSVFGCNNEGYTNSSDSSNTFGYSYVYTQYSWINSGGTKNYMSNISLIKWNTNMYNPDPNLRIDMFPDKSKISGRHELIFLKNGNEFYTDGELVATIDKNDIANFTKQKAYLGKNKTYAYSKFLLFAIENYNLTYSDSIDYYYYSVGDYRIYHFAVWEKNILKKDMYPCYKISNNEIGLYDIVNNVFYTNQGTGSFEKGPNID